MAVYCPESDTTYATLELWESGEAGATFKTAEISGTVATSGMFELRDDSFTGGALICAANGEEFDPSDVNAAVATIDGAIRIVSRNNGVFHNVKDIKLEYGNLFTTVTDNPDGFYSNCLFRKDSATDTVDFLTLSSGSSTTGFIDTCVFDGVGSNNVVDGIFSSDAAPNFTVTNCTAVGVPRFGFIRAKFINNLVIDSASSGTGSDFFLLQAGSDYNASSDSTATGTNSFTSRTTADLADYAGGDWRTASSSPLSTGGESGGFIGVAVESAGGGIVEDAATDLTLADGSIDSVSIAEQVQTNTLLVDGSLDLLAITEDVTTNVSLVDASIDSISLNESSKTELTLVDNSTDTASGSIVESAVTVMLVVDNSADSISISDSGVAELTLVDNSTDEVASGVVSSEVTELTLVGVSTDSIGLTESAPVELTLVDNSIDSVSKESIDSGVIILASLADAEITATLTEIEIRAYL